MDLLLFLEGRRVGVEFKRADSPAITRSMRIALTDLKLDELWIVYPGDRAMQLEGSQFLAHWARTPG